MLIQHVRVVAFLALLLTIVPAAHAEQRESRPTSPRRPRTVTPDFGPDWQLRFQVQLLFPR